MPSKQRALWSVRMALVLCSIGWAYLGGLWAAGSSSVESPATKAGVPSQETCAAETTAAIDPAWVDLLLSQDLADFDKEENQGSLMSDPRNGAETGAAPVRCEDFSQRMNGNAVFYACVANDADCPNPGLQSRCSAISSWTDNCRSSCQPNTCDSGTCNVNVGSGWNPELNQGSTSPYTGCPASAPKGCFIYVRGTCTCGCR